MLNLPSGFTQAISSEHGAMLSEVGSSTAICNNGQQP